MKPEDIAALNLEAIEVLLNHILYVRGLYPIQIFKKKRVYNTPVFTVSFPALNSYMANVLRTLQQLQRNPGHQLKLEIIVFGDDTEHVESYFLEIHPVKSDQQQVDQDQYLIDYEEQLRSALYKLAERVKKLPKLTKNAKFKVHIHTTQTAFTQLIQDAQYQEFPWLQDVENAQLNPHQFSLLPLATVDKVGLKMMAQIRS